MLETRFVATPGRLAFSLPDSSLHGQRGRCPSRFYGGTELQNLFLHCEPRYAIMHSDVAFKAGSS